MNEFFTTAILTATVASGIQLAAPFLLASLGETIGQRSGVLNLGVDGIMKASAKRLLSRRVTRLPIDRRALRAFREPTSRSGTPAQGF